MCAFRFEIRIHKYYIIINYQWENTTIPAPDKIFNKH